MFDVPGRLREEDIEEYFRPNEGLLDIRRVVREEVRIKDHDDGMKTDNVTLTRSRSSNAVAGADIRLGHSRFFEPGDIVNRKRRTGTVRHIGDHEAVGASTSELLEDSVQVNMDEGADSTRQTSESTLLDTLVEEEAERSDSEDTVIIHTVEDSDAETNRRSSDDNADVLARAKRLTVSCPLSSQESHSWKECIG